MASKLNFYIWYMMWDEGVNIFCIPKVLCNNPSITYPQKKKKKKKNPSITESEISPWQKTSLA